MLVHCLAGQSRSPAFALAIIVRGLIQPGFDRGNQQSVVEHASDLLLGIRRQSRLNGLLLQLCFAQFPLESTAKDLAAAFVNHPHYWKTAFDCRRRPAARVEVIALETEAVSFHAMRTIEDGDGEEPNVQSNRSL